ncbi:MAG: fatty acid desaturase [Chloroflexi bacterium]|nr:fatty acid desaturase [Chloroflexota bacterium]MCL5273152.1 fatty acid desaturase [Chloroflexota bacterium]
MNVDQRKSSIAWYRTPVDRATLDALNRRSDVKGLLQTFGHLGLLALTGGAAWYAAGRWAFPVVLLILFAHGTFYAFLLNGFHELCHKSVFRTKALNTIFLYIFSFLGWYNPVMFWASHQEHHKYTLHPPDDMEVLLPVKLTLKHFYKAAILNPWLLIDSLKGVIRLSRGRLQGEWENALFPPAATDARRRLFTWARITLFGHALLIVVSAALGWWMLPVVVTLAPFYGGWLLFLCNNAQHIGLQDDVPDYRLCCRTIILNPFVSFLYWRMNYHTEHHMYAAAPCYNLPKLHQAIKHDLPHCPVGLVETWRVISAILERQKTEPEYAFAPELPAQAGA